LLFLKEKYQTFSKHLLTSQAVDEFIERLDQTIEEHPITQIQELENEKEYILQNLRQSSCHADSHDSIDMMEDEVDAKTMNNYQTIDDEIKEMSAHYGFNDSKTWKEYLQEYQNLNLTQKQFTYSQSCL